jgi:hypothetical protein
LEIAADDVIKLSSTEVASVDTVATHAPAINANIMAYSIDVGPDSSRKNSRTLATNLLSTVNTPQCGVGGANLVEKSKGCRFFVNRMRSSKLTYTLKSRSGRHGMHAQYSRFVPYK